MDMVQVRAGSRSVYEECFQKESKSHYINCVLAFLGVLSKVKGKSVRKKRQGLVGVTV